MTALNSIFFFFFLNNYFVNLVVETGGYLHKNFVVLLGKPAIPGILTLTEIEINNLRVTYSSFETVNAPLGGDEG